MKKLTAIGILYPMIALLSVHLVGNNFYSLFLTIVTCLGIYLLDE